VLVATSPKAWLASLGTAVLAVVLVDLLWAVFMLAGVESVHFTPPVGYGELTGEL